MSSSRKYGTSFAVARSSRPPVLHRQKQDCRKEAPGVIPHPFSRRYFRQNSRTHSLVFSRHWCKVEKTALNTLFSFLKPPAFYPKGVGNVNWFGFFNALSFSIFLGAPVTLYAKSLGADATLLGLFASLTPLLTVFQIPAA
jgi:hypothetical protein